MYANNDILFPHHAIAALKNVRGEAWAQLITRITQLPENHEETLAFMLMMIRLNGCLNCETDSYRAMRGCITCASQVLRRYKGSDDDLMALYEQALHDIRQFAQQSPPIPIIQLQATEST